MQTATAHELTAEERQAVLTWLNETRDNLRSEVAHLSEAQATFKPSPDRWSVAENVEHLSIVEKFSAMRIQALKDGEVAPPGRPSVADHLRASVLKRDPANRVSTPPQAAPSGNVPLAEALTRFETARQLTIALADDPYIFHGRLVPHPILPPMDGYEWLLAFAGHSARHVEQIRELKAHPDFSKA